MRKTDADPATATNNNEKSLHRVASLSVAHLHELVEFHFTAAPEIITYTNGCSFDRIS